MIFNKNLPLLAIKTLFFLVMYCVFQKNIVTLHRFLNEANERISVMETNAVTNRPSVNMVDAIWTLVQCQTKSVQRALTRRFVVLDAKQRADKNNVISPKMQVLLDASRKDIREGKGTTCHSKTELFSFLDTL